MHWWLVLARIQTELRSSRVSACSRCRHCVHRDSNDSNECWTSPLGVFTDQPIDAGQWQACRSPWASSAVNVDRTHGVFEVLLAASRSPSAQMADPDLQSPELDLARPTFAGPSSTSRSPNPASLRPRAITTARCRLAASNIEKQLSVSRGTRFDSPGLSTALTRGTSRACSTAHPRYLGVSSIGLGNRRRARIHHCRCAYWSGPAVRAVGRPPFHVKHRRVPIAQAGAELSRVDRGLPPRWCAASRTIRVRRASPRPVTSIMGDDGRRCDAEEPRATTPMHEACTAEAPTSTRSERRHHSWDAHTLEAMHRLPIRRSTSVEVRPGMPRESSHVIESHPQGTTEVETAGASGAARASSRRRSQFDLVFHVKLEIAGPVHRPRATTRGASSSAGSGGDGVDLLVSVRLVSANA